jgi:hypothetical protein
MDEWRACVAIDLETKKGIVYFSNSKNGNILTDHIINQNVTLEAALNNFFQKFGFARTVSDLGENEIKKVIKIITRHELDINELQEKGLVKVTIKQPNLTITCQPGHSLLTLAIKNEFEDFMNNQQKKSGKNLIVEDKEDKQGVASLTISIDDAQLYEQFIAKLNKDNLLPKKIGTPKNPKDSSYQPPRLT